MNTIRNRRGTEHIEGELAPVTTLTGRKYGHHRSPHTHLQKKHRDV